MSKAPAKPAETRTTEIEQFDKRQVDYTKLKSDLTAAQVQKFFGPTTGTGPGGASGYYLGLIDTLSVTRTIGKGRTNLTLIEPTIVQVDAMTPSATFDKTKSARNPTVQVHFQPSGYGITSVSGYHLDFALQIFTPGAFNVVGQAEGSPVLNTGVKNLNGLVTVTVVMQNVSPTAQTFVFIEQQSGGAWSWLSTQIFFPPLVAQP
jgi:hypothetical protein